MKNCKKSVIAALLLMLLLLTACGTEQSPEIEGDMKPHFMVNGRLYWASTHPSGTMPESFQYAGDIVEEVEETPVSDWTSYGHPAGTKVYLDPEKPHQAWIGGGNRSYRYHTEDAGRDYVRHDGDLYVYLGSVNAVADEYYDAYENWDYIVNIQNYATTYVGATVFEEYDSYPVQELGSNAFTQPHGVYVYEKDTDILFAAFENEGRVYVKVKA